MRKGKSFSKSQVAKSISEKLFEIREKKNLRRKIKATDVIIYKLYSDQLFSPPVKKI